MNEAPADSSAPKPPGEGWSRQRWLMLVAFVFAAQVTLILALGEKQFPPQRAVANVPQFTLADSANEMIALDDPTLFALPHGDNFAPAVSGQMLVVANSSFRWTEPPGELLSPAVGNLGAVFTRFMQTNQFATINLNFKPEPELSEPVLSLQPAFAENSTLRVEGELAQRKLLNPLSLPSWPYADVIAPSRVQVLVDADGGVFSPVLLPPDNPGEVHDSDADQRALELARGLRFAPASRPAFGQLIFDWRTVAPSATNSPAAAP